MQYLHLQNWNTQRKIKLIPLCKLTLFQILFSNFHVPYKELTVSKGTLSPDFDKEKLSYTVTVPSSVDKITINGVLESVNATATGLGIHNLKQGRNEFQIVVTSKDNKKRTYSVVVYRVESSDARLKSVTFKEGKLSLISDDDYSPSYKDMEAIK